MEGKKLHPPVPPTSNDLLSVGVNTAASQDVRDHEWVGFEVCDTPTQLDQPHSRAQHSTHSAGDTKHPFDDANVSRLLLAFGRLGCGEYRHTPRGRGRPTPKPITLTTTA